MSGLADSDFGPAGDGEGVALRDRGRGDRGRALIRERGSRAHHGDDRGNEREQSHDHAKLLGLDVVWNASAVPDARAATPGTRTTSAGVTHELTDIWPEVRARLLGYLSARGISPANADDIVQDVAERVISHRVCFVDADDLLRWCFPVARHASVDQHRRSARLVSTHCVVDRATDDDLADTVGAKLRLRRVVDGWSKLSSSERQALVDAAQDAGPVLDGATRVRRHRARKRLLELVGPAAVLGFAIRAVRRFGRTGAAVIAPAAVAASFIIGADGGAVSPAPVIAMAPDHSRATSQVHPSADGVTTTRDRRTSVGLAVMPARPTTRPKASAPVRLYGHDRRPQDRGLVCVASLPLVDSVCVGPSKNSV